MWCSTTLEVTKTCIKGYLRKTVQKIKVFQQMQFPQRYYLCDKVRRTLYIYNEPNGKIREVIDASKMMFVEYPEQTEF